MDPILAICLIALIVLVALYVAHRLFPAQVDAVQKIPLVRSVEGVVYRAGEGTVDEFADYVDKLNPNPPAASAQAGAPASVDKPAVVVSVAVPTAPNPTSAPIAPAV